MAGGADTERGPGPARIASRVVEHRATVLAAAVVLGVCVFAFDLPVPVGAGGFALILAASAWRRPGDPAIPRSASAGAGQRPVWPDSGMKVVLDALTDPCFLTDAAGIQRYQNQAAVDRFGPGRPGDPLSFKLRVPELLAAVDRAALGRRSDGVAFTDRAPTERVYSASAVPLQVGRRDVGGRADFVLVRLRDDTELHRTERMRADFVANASHELRTPLASLTGFVETLLGPARNDEVNRERFLRIMLDQAQRMGRLIDDLLSLSRIEMKAHLRPEGLVDLAEVAEIAAETFAPTIATSGATLVVDTGGGGHPVRGDRDELIQVTSNLLENAVKYGRPEGTVRLTVAREAGPDGTAGVLLSVADDGPGIGAEHLPRLTERFYRVDADSSRRQKGTGLGLAIVKHIVNRHRGRLAIRSTVGEGTVVTVWIALADQTAPALIS